MFEELRVGGSSMSSGAEVLRSCRGWKVGGLVLVLVSVLMGRGLGGRREEESSEREDRLVVEVLVVEVERLRDGVRDEVDEVRDEGSSEEIDITESAAVIDSGMFLVPICRERRPWRDAI
jgi:hypothetical protein